MAGKDWTEIDRLETYRRLEESLHQFGFFQALRLIECSYPGRAKIGQAQKPNDESIRLGQEASLAFAASSIDSFRFSDSDIPKLKVLFFGLFGPNGPLPLHLTEYVRDRIRNHDDDSLAEFTDIFHHRLLSLFYRAWAESNPVTNLDRPKNDRHSKRVAGLIGVRNSVYSDNETPDYQKLYFAGRYASQTKNEEGLRAILEHFLGMSVKIDQFVGTWMEIPEIHQWRLGESRQTGCLGENSSLGKRVWERQGKFRLKLGPLDKQEFDSLLPGGKILKRLIEIVFSYVGDELDWDINLVLKGEEVTPATLGESSQLGWTTWMSERFPNRNFDNLYLNPRQEMI